MKTNVISGLNRLIVPAGVNLYKFIPIILVLLLASVLRLYSLDRFPAGLNADEAAIGYNAWSLLETGKDEHSVTWPLVFRSFDDYKLPVYFYLVLPFVKILGLTVTAVRLPSALLGIASVFLVYLIIKLLFPSSTHPVIPAKVGIHPEKLKTLSLRGGTPTWQSSLSSLRGGTPTWQSHSNTLALLSALLLAISPWHLQFSRGGWEVNAATFLILLGIWGFLKALESPKYLYLFVVSLALSFYTYHSARIISPLLALSLVILYRQQLFSGTDILKTSSLRGGIPTWQSPSTKLRTIILATLLGVLLTFPIASQLLSKEGQSRFSGVSIFADSGPEWQATNYRLQHTDRDDLGVRLIHNRYLSYSLRFVQNYLSHYSPGFLFLNGDAIDRSRVPETGESLLFLLPFYAFGLLSLIKLDSLGKKFILAWFLIAPLAASLTYQSPHALRAQNMVVPLSIITAMGLSSAIIFFQNHKSKHLLWVFEFLIFLISGYSIARYLHMYYVHYPQELPFAWQYGFDQIAAYTKDNYDKYDRIIITDRYDQPYILIAFFTKYPPADLQRDIVMSEPDHYGFATGLKLSKYEFRSINYEQDKLLPNTLLVTAEEKVDETQVIGDVKSPSGVTMFKLTSTSK